MAVVGFEPMPLERLEPKSSALDHSATQEILFAENRVHHSKLFLSVMYRERRKDIVKYSAVV